MRYQRIVEPITEVISLTEAKLHLKVTDSTDDTLIANLIKASRAWCEQITGNEIGASTSRVYFDSLPSSFEMGKYPINSITGIYYTDTTGVVGAMASTSYYVDNTCIPSRIVPAYGVSWPDNRTFTNSVYIEFVAGWTSANCPEPIKAAILLILGHLYENRQDVIVSLERLPFGARQLLDNYRSFTL